KRKRQDGVETSPVSAKKSKGTGRLLPSVHTEAAYNKFLRNHGLDCSRATFVGICAYLYHLIRWHYAIPPSAFDEFVCSHSTFLRDPSASGANQKRVLPYHRWFALNKAQCSRPGGILGGYLLYDIGVENPYTFALTEESMELIAKKASEEHDIARPGA
ncbi:MAG: hypothetical protein Q9205_006106, partial [Flavoplaca limonia]